MTRLLPLSISRYPFNNDALTECGIASEILGSGHLEFSHNAPWSITHSVATPLMNVLLAFFSGLIDSTPLDCGQILGAIVALTTVGGLFLLGRLFSGDLRGAVVAGMMGVLFGTFVFTTGSIWKEMLGISLLVLAIMSYIRREDIRFRAVTFVILLCIPGVHHLVTAVVFLIFAYLLSWSWIYAISHRSLSRRHLYDLVTIAVPGVVAAYYYSSVQLDRLIQFSTPKAVLVLIAGFFVISLIASIILSISRHSRLTFAPLVGVGLAVVLFLDYSGFIFPYTHSASEAYLLLGFASAFILSVAWYGAEIILEERVVYRAIQLVLLMAPITVIGLGLLQGFSVKSQQILYRTFDFFDLFLFLGAAVGLSTLWRRHRRLYPVVGAALIVSLLVSFPFAYATSELLGVRHDTQPYEVDALNWVDHRNEPTVVISDERIGYIASSTIWITKDSSLPDILSHNETFLWYPWFYMIEDSWTTIGVNDFPHGKIVISESQYARVKEGSDVFYVGGPVNDHVILFGASEMGWNTVYGISTMLQSPF